MDLVIRNVRLIDGTGSGPQSSVSLEVSNGAVTWVGEESARPKRPRHQEDINGQGLTLIPGLIDCHEHFTGDGGMDSMDRLLNDTAEEFTLKAVGNCRRALMSGVTSARDVGARHAININIARQAAAGAADHCLRGMVPVPGHLARRAHQDHRNPRGTAGGNPGHDPEGRRPHQGGRHRVPPQRRAIRQHEPRGPGRCGAGVPRGWPQDRGPLPRLRGHPVGRRSWHRLHRTRDLRGPAHGRTHGGEGYIHGAHHVDLGRQGAPCDPDGLVKGPDVRNLRP